MTMLPAIPRIISTLLMAGAVVGPLSAPASSAFSGQSRQNNAPFDGMQAAVEETATPVPRRRTEAPAAGSDVWWMAAGPNRHAAAGRTLTFTNFTASGIFAAGGDVLLDAVTVANDVFAIGGEITASKTTAKRIFAAGRSLALSDLTARDILATGGDMLLKSVRIDGDIVASGGHMTMDAGSSIGGAVWVNSIDLNLSGTVAGDLTATGKYLRIDGRIGRNSRLSAEHLEIGPDVHIGGDLVTDGGLLTITDVAARDIVAAGSAVFLEGVTASNDIILSGERVVVDSKSQVTGNAVLMAEEIELSGAVEGDLTVAGGQVRLNGRIDGDVDLTAERLIIGPAARIAGALAHRAKHIDISSEAEISGAVVALADDKGVTRSTLFIPLIGVGILAVLILMPASIVLALALAGGLPGLMADPRDFPLGRDGLRLLVNLRRAFAFPRVMGMWPARPRTA